jgi:hypothetical protein
MPEYLSPGVYIEEVNTGPRPIEGVGTAMAAFVGFADHGPANYPQLITNWTQYLNVFCTDAEGKQHDPHVAGAFLSYAVRGYFLNGGGRCYVTRVVPPTVQEQPVVETHLPSRQAYGAPALTVKPKQPINTDIEIIVEPPSGEEDDAEDIGEDTFNLHIRMGRTEELYENVSLGNENGRNVVTTVNQTSRLVMLVEAQPSGSLVERTPAVGTYELKALPPVAVSRVESNHFVGDTSERSGVVGMEISEEITMLCCPDLMAAYRAGSMNRDGVKAVQQAMIEHCEHMGDRIAILDPLPDFAPQDIAKWRKYETNYDSMYAALYYPWIKVQGPNGEPIAVPPCGHIAGVFARNDQERGVHKAPANEVIKGALGAAIEITKGEQDILNPTGVNCIRSFTGRGLRIWGARTLSNDPAWRYVNVRRLFNYVERSIELGTQWIVFEPNDPDLWARVKRDVGAFLTAVWREGMLFGRTAEEAFYVKCDEELNPPETRDQGKLFIEIGMAPVKPAEFVVFRFSQFTGGGA